jgi:hypothetical protein
VAWMYYWNLVLLATGKFPDVLHFFGWGELHSRGASPSLPSNNRRISDLMAPLRERGTMLMRCGGPAACGTPVETAVF